MAEYIEREIALKKMCESCCEYDSERECFCNEQQAILGIAAADVTPVRRGKWIALGQRTYGGGRSYTHYCSECGQHGFDDFKRCPNCGAYLGDVDNA